MKILPRVGSLVMLVAVAAIAGPKPGGPAEKPARVHHAALTEHLARAERMCARWIVI